MERFADLGVTAGCATDPLRYCPDKPVTRAQMATFFQRAFQLPDAPPRGFIDTAGNTHEDNIDALAAVGTTVGCSTLPLRYCPDRTVTRAQMGTFLARALGLVEVPKPTAFTAVSAGPFHSCGLRGNGTIVCWGRNTDWQRNVPDGTYASVSAGTRHTCALRTDSTAVCWGNDRYGQRSAPDGTFSAVSAGWRHTCGLRTDETIVCWGAKDHDD